MQHHNTCPVCGSAQTEVLFSAPDWLVTKLDFKICRCRNCGFSFTQDHPEASESARYYDSAEYISHTDSRKTLLDKAYQAARNFMLGRKAALVAGLSGKKSGFIVDIGSGTGHFLGTMKSNGWQVAGIEISDNARIYSASKFSVDVYSPEEFSKIQPGSADCVSLWHVAEHLHDLDAYFNKISSILKTEAVLIVALPNSSSSDARHYSKYWAAWDVPRHLWHFNPGSFRLFAKQKGLSLVSVRRLPLDVFYISILSEKNKGSRFAAISGLIKGAFFFLCSLIRKENSSSLVYILKKETD